MTDAEIQDLLAQKKATPRPEWVDFKTGVKTAISEEFENCLILMKPAFRNLLITLLKLLATQLVLNIEELILAVREMTTLLSKKQLKKILALQKQAIIEAIRQLANICPKETGFSPVEAAQLFQSSLSSYPSRVQEVLDFQFQEAVVQAIIADFKNRVTLLKIAVENITQWQNLLDRYK